MPTGYTSAVADGKIATLREFALQCARGMGALYAMRDEPWDAPIPNAIPANTSYRDEKIAEAEKLLAEVIALSDEQAERRALMDYEHEVQRRAKYAAEQEETKARYDAMSLQVASWEGAPEGLKSFMMEQLAESVRFDCVGMKYYPEPMKLSGSEWRKAQIDKATRDLSYHRNELAKEIHRANERNAWLAQLHASLAGVPQ